MHWRIEVSTLLVQVLFFAMIGFRLVMVSIHARLNSCMLLHLHSEAPTSSWSPKKNIFDLTDCVVLCLYMFVDSSISTAGPLPLGVMLSC